MDNRKIVNLGIVAHVDAGKTTLTEQILLICEAIRTAGSVDDGTAHTDFMEIERQRGISVKSASTALSWKDVDINLIDTPGHVDFVAEVERAVWIVDCVVLVVSAVEGIQAQTEVIWRALHDLNKPVIFFINKIDRAGADVERVFGDIKEKFSQSVVMFNGANIESEIFTQEIEEAVAENDDGLLEKYLEGGLTAEVICGNLGKQFFACKIYPVISGSAMFGKGIENLMDLIINICPNDYYGDEKADNAKEDLSGVVFKIEHSKSLGRLAHVRMYAGSIKNRDVVHNLTQNLNEKIVQIRKNKLQKSVDMGMLSAGDIGVVCGFSHVQLGDVLGSGKYIPQSHKMAAPLLKVKVIPEDESQYPQLVDVISELAVEDPLLEMTWEREERELVISITGMIQLEILEALIMERFGLRVSFSPPSVIYKETPAKSGYGFEAYTMPKPCWAIIKFLLEPGERGSGVSYKSEVGDQKILYRYQSQIEQALPGSLKQGPLGWNVTDMKITLVDGESHFLHTHPLDFIMTTPMAMMNGLVSTGTDLLEPMLNFRISVEESLGGKMIREILDMRGTFDSPVISKGTFTMEGRYPAASSIDFPVRLASMSSGRGMLSSYFSGYEICPLELGKTTPYRGINPLDRQKYILHIRNAYELKQN